MDSTAGAELLNMEELDHHQSVVVLSTAEEEGASVQEEEAEEVLLRNINNNSDQHRTTRLWNVFGRRLPRSEIVFFCQTFIIYVVVVTSLVNLTLKNGPINLWIALLGSCLGYLLPHPSIDTRSSNNQYQEQPQLKGE